MIKTEPDVILDQFGSIVGLTPLTSNGRRWIARNCQIESWMWLGGVLNIDFRYVEAIVDGMKDDGLTVQDHR